MVFRSFGVLFLAWTHVLRCFLWCSLGVFSLSLFCLTDRFDSPVFLCRTCEDSIVKYIMDDSYGGWPLKAALSDSHCMQPSNDTYQDMVVDLTTLGVVDLNTSIMPDVFGLRAFDSREPVARILPGDFANTICMLVPDATAAPIGFHDVMLENLANSPDYRGQTNIAQRHYLPPEAVAVFFVCGHA